MPRATPPSTAWNGPLEPTPLIAKGTAVGVRGKAWTYVEIVPHPSLDLAFEDLVPHLLDSSYWQEAGRVHLDHDSVATTVRSIRHVFRVEAGELTIEVPTAVSPETSYQEAEAVGQGWDVTKGRSARPTRVGAVYFHNELSQSWRNPRTLRQFREPRKAPGPSEKQTVTPAAPLATSVAGGR